MNHKTLLQEIIMSIKQQIININGKYETLKINIKNRTCYFFNDMINIEEFDSSLQNVIQKYWYLQHWIH